MYGYGFPSSGNLMSFGGGYGSVPPLSPQIPMSMGIPLVGGPGSSPLGGNDPAVPAGADAATGEQTWLQKIGGLEGIASLAKGLGSLGQIFTAMQGVKLAREQLNFSKQAYETNLRNTTKNYNTSLEDRINARYHTEGRSADDVSAYLSKHSL